jgi:nucleoside 2-deoxyribosyltransferase
MEEGTHDGIFERNMESIRKCDLLFANITPPDSYGAFEFPSECYGTFVEIGLAHALGKPVYVAVSYKLIFQINEFWIAMKCAKDTNTYKTDEDLVHVFIEFLKQETSHRQDQYTGTVSRQTP